jgi:phage baseplate assembly protein W
MTHTSAPAWKTSSPPKGSRLARREYGSDLPDMIDKPLNGKTRMQCMAASVIALARWEPRVDISKVQMQVGTGEQAGALAIDITGTKRDGTGNFEIHHTERLT